MTYNSSLTPMVIHLFRASLLFVALLSTFYAHFSFSLPLFSLLVVSSFVLLNIMFMYKKVTACGRLLQPKKLSENEIIKQKTQQTGDEKVLDQTPVKSTSSSPDDNDFTITNFLGPPDSISSDHLCERSNKDFTGEKFELGSAHCDTLSSSLESISEDVEEDYLIEIALPERKKQKLERESLDLVSESVLQQQGLEDFLSDINEISGEENLIEIDISMGLIRQSGSVCEIAI